jgi:hypothetical protein
MSVDYDEEKWGKLDLQFLIIDTAEYIVFIDNKDDLDWITTKEYDKQGHKDKIKHFDVINKVALLECKPLQQFDKHIKLNYKRLLGESIARSINHDYQNAINILKHAEDYIKERGSELSRMWYLEKSSEVTIIFLILGFISWIFRACSIKLLGEDVFYHFLCVISGAAGALLSIIFRMGKENLDCLAGKNIHELESICRIIAGMLSALLGGVLVRADLLPIFSKIENTEIALILVGFIAGMSERFAPSILAKMEKANN